MLIPVLLFIVGLLFLIKGGDWFVDGASALARRFHLPELLIGATVVSIGTTLPEVMVSTMSALSGHGEIAYGNAIGSVICNAALIAAITIAVRPGRVDPKTLKTPVAFFFAAAAIYCIAAYVFGRFTRVMGIIMLATFVAYMAVNVLQMKNTPAGAQEASEEEEMPLAKTLILLVLGAVLIAVGANLLVDNGTLIAQALGVPESVIALTFVALGTSLPELVTAITSLVKGHSDLSLGNIVGANVFNLVLVSGMSITLAPFTIPQSATLFGINSSLVLDLPVMLAVMLILTVPALVKGKLNRAQGILLLAIYAAFCAVQFARKEKGVIAHVDVPCLTCAAPLYSSKRLRQGDPRRQPGVRHPKDRIEFPCPAYTSARWCVCWAFLVCFCRRRQGIFCIWRCISKAGPSRVRSRRTGSARPLPICKRAGQPPHRRGIR